MYFHPLILTEEQRKQRAAAYQELAQLCVDGLDRQHRLHADAVSAFCAKRRDSLQELSQSMDTGEFLVRCLVYPAPAAMELLRASIRSGEIAVDVQRQAVAVMDRHAAALVRDLTRGLNKETVPHSEQMTQKRSRRQQMAA